MLSASIYTPGLGCSKLGEDNLGLVSVNSKLQLSLIRFGYNLMIRSSQKTAEKYPKKCFWTNEKKPGLKFNPGWALINNNNWVWVKRDKVELSSLSKETTRRERLEPLTSGSGVRSDNCSITHASTMGCSLKKWENYPRNCFWTKVKEPRIKI